jgi:diguanylate cyclase (GGDEF)-like protein
MDQNTVKQFSQLTNNLYSESTFKGLLTGFAQTLKSYCRCAQFGAIVIEAQAANRISLKLDGIKTLPASAVEQFSKVMETKESHDDFLTGWSHIELGNCQYYFCAVPYQAQAANRCFLLWSVDKDSTPNHDTMDLLVMQLQREAHWYHKLENTQTLLYKDDLTGLFNFRFFEVAIDNELARSGRFATQFCILFIDLDHLKPINDTYGHMSGSSVIRAAAGIIREAVREIDIPIRYGGDEFVVILLGATSSKGVLVAERIRQKVADHNFKMEDGSTAHVTASIGVAAYPEHGKSRSDLLRMADESMYKSKRAGKNRVTLVSDTPSSQPKTQNQKPI